MCVCAGRVVRSLVSLEGYITATNTSSVPQQNTHPTGSDIALVNKGGAELAVPDIKVKHVFGARTYKMERLLCDAASVPGGFASACQDLQRFVSSFDSTSACVAAPEWDVGWRRGVIPAEADGVHVQRTMMPLEPSSFRPQARSERGGTFFVQCLSTSGDGSAHFFDVALVQKQIYACGLVHTARMGRCVLPVRVRMSAFWYPNMFVCVKTHIR